MSVLDTRNQDASNCEGLITRPAAYMDITGRFCAVCRKWPYSTGIAGKGVFSTPRGIMKNSKYDYDAS